MSKLTTVGGTAAALALTLSLAACGGSHDGSSDKIKGAAPGKASPSTSPSPSASTSESPGAPTFDFPKDVKVTINSPTTGNKTKDAILRDLGYADKAINLAFVKQDPNLPVFTDYVIGDAAAGWRSSVNNFKKKGETISGEIIYDSYEVKKVNGSLASVFYCENQRHAFPKKVASGKVIHTEPSAKDFIGHAATMQRGTDGTWRLLRQFNDEGAARCQR